MLPIYNLAIRLYVFLIRLAAITGNPKAKKWVEGRRNWRRGIPSLLPAGEKRIWFHCSSLGEFEQGRPLMEKIRRQEPGVRIILTFFSPSGYEIRKNYTGADAIFYLPIDTKKNAEDLVNLIRPEKVFFIKYEFWYHYFRVLAEKKIPLYVVSAVFREDARFFKWYGGMFRKMLDFVTHFFVQNGKSKDILQSSGLTNVTVSGDTRFDRVLELVKNARDIPAASAFAKNAMVLTAGSTWPEDEELLVNVLHAFRGKLKVILAPHETGENQLADIENTFQSYRVVRFSKSSTADLASADVLLIDNIGMLSSLYRYGQFAYVGGGFGKGIHNILEAAVYGVPVFFGPNHKKFLEAEGLINKGGAFTVSTPGQMKEWLNQLLSDKTMNKIASGAAAGYVLEHSGATEIILKQLSGAHSR